MVALEGWPHLLAGLLPKAIALQRLAAPQLLPHTCLRYLALPPDACDPEDRCVRCVDIHV